MKKKSTSRSAFLNPRVLIGLFIVLAGVCLALLGFGTRSVQAQQNKKTRFIDIPGLPPGFDCSTIHAKGIDRMENLGAGLIMIACGESPRGSASRGSAFSRLVQKLLPTPLAYGAADVDLITGTETFPSVTQSETYTTANPDNPNQIVVNYNDSRSAPSCYAGVSYSSDGGATFTRLNPCPLCTGHGTNFGDPVMLYNKPTSTFFAIDIATGCGGFGLGSWKSTDGGVTWSVGACVHNGSNDDRESGYADNNPSSPFFGRMYASWNDFNVGNAALSVTYSSDNGATWHSPIIVSNTSTFIRDVQITSDKVTGDVYIAGMDEGGGGFPHNDVNHIYKSTDGGNTWTNTYTGPSFSGPGVTAVGYFACMFPDNGGYWRHEGWGEPAAFNNVVHLVYAQHGTGSDAGDVYYIRSTDGGVTFSAPFKLNSDSTTRPQWQPNISVSDAGTLLAMWYDARESTTCTYANPGVPCYRMWARKSNDNGMTWLADDTLSDVVSPLPGQPDFNVQPTYAGDYDYGTAILTKHLTSWVDGRVTISSQSQQDAFTDRELVGFSVTTTDPACNSVITTQPVDFVVNLSDPADPSTVQPTDFTVNGIAADSDTLSNGNATITFHFNSTPVTTQGLQTMDIPAGAILRASDEMPIFEFMCTFCYAPVQLMVTTTVPPVGGTFSPPAPGDYQYDVNWNQAVDPTSVTTSDLTLTGNAGGSVTNVQVINGDMTTRFTVHFNFGGSATASIAAGAITAAAGGCNTNAAFTGNYTVEGCPPQIYVTVQGTGTITPGGTDIGNHCDDCETQIDLPFPVNVYGSPISVAAPGSNGDIQFTATPSAKVFYWLQCVPVNPDPTQQGPFLNTLFPYYDDLRTDQLDVCPDCGIFTQTVGTAPNRQFVIRWKTTYFNFSGTAEFEVLLTEGSDTLSVIYGASENNGLTAASGIQQDLNMFTSFSCFEAVLTPGVRVDYVPPGCASPTPTPTPTATATATPTPTSTPRPVPTPRPRPTPPPRP